MNLFDSQPNAFLDYAWTSPSPAPPANAKPSKTSRKQNRCCDQCRRGKRACDATILEDTLLDGNNTPGGPPAAFHYSDVFGPLAPCGNCEKTKKNCTFEWLRTQRMSQAALPSSSTPPAKKRRTQSNSLQNRKESARQLRVAHAPQQSALPGTRPGGDVVSKSESIEPGLTFADFPGQIPAFDITLTSPFISKSEGSEYNGFIADAMSATSYAHEVLDNEDEAPQDRDSGIQTSPELAGDSSEAQSTPLGTSEDGDGLKSVGPVMRIPRKRRRHSSSSSLSGSAASWPTISSTDDLASSTNNALLAESLLRIYSDSFEHHLSCWLTERTCPSYSKDSEVSLPHDDGPDWNRIYHRVFKLDRLSSVRGRSLSSTEHKAASKAINLAIFAFATQWTQADQKSEVKYPFHSDVIDRKSSTSPSEAATKSKVDGENFDRAFQMTAWHQARMALQEAAEVESFRVVLAQIVFSLTQRPFDKHEQGMYVPGVVSGNHIESPVQAEKEYEGMPRPEPPQLEDRAVDECQDLLSRLNLTVAGDGPPIYLEQGLRLIHSLRSRMTMAGTIGNRSKKIPRYWKQACASPYRLDPADRTTVDLLFWLGVMFDTLSSAMHKRPLVVSLEDSDLPSTREAVEETPIIDKGGDVIYKPEDHWDDYLFGRQRRRLQRRPMRWPCSYEAAASILCEAAPIKVLLFRKVTRIQTLLSRRVQGERVEKALQAALEVHAHWQKSFAPFIRDCIDNHDRLPSSVQSWYVCLTGHWHLATLLLADLIEVIDETELSVEAQRRERSSSDFIAAFREKNCRWLSDIARCACPNKQAPFAHPRGLSAVDQGALLTEPWTVVLIRAFATAGAILLESSTRPDMHVSDQEDMFQRANDCVVALSYLGKRSDMAFSAAKILGDALVERRRRVKEKLDEMSTFLDNELWSVPADLGELDRPYGVECV